MTADDEQHDRAGEILDAALRRLVDEEGFDRLEACRTLIVFGLSMMPAMCCRHHLIAELRELQRSLEQRITEVPNLEPGRDIARCAGLH